eukprot:CAMPEP_0119549674 /NCGR_PEP_ID=MMETSP1352-20130426/3326_1 /TAXON_ID=265584 /ORGANISM="Stauroneis constricta, Strain CCMP1120" /LENGTH=516 /DNA_ID=CAMNT_0007595277 /DNA_START=33 /DNA_END=1583 /DNA_ORIENTATION=-
MKESSSDHSNRSRSGTIGDGEEDGLDETVGGDNVNDTFRTAAGDDTGPPKADAVTTTNGGNENDEEANKDESGEAEGEEEKQEEPKRPLYKSPRMKGYLTIAFASIIQFRDALDSDYPINTLAVSASPRQRAYATTVSIASASIACALVLIHLDRYSPLQGFWYRCFSAKSTFEWYVIGFLLLWWSVATVIQTGVRGIAGDGKGQFNVYYSTWVCMWASFYCMDKKFIDHGWLGFRSFISSWPFRAPGWISIFISCFFTLCWYVDLFLNTAQDRSKLSEALNVFYSAISESQYQTSLILAAFTLIPSAVFVFVEIFRETTIREKSNLETILEGFSLFLLAVGWIPAVIITTTPGGFASLVGNSYFFTWVTAALVLETSLWFVHDCRASIHSKMQEKEREYKRHQEQVLQNTRRIVERQHDLDDAASAAAASHSNMFSSTLMDSGSGAARSIRRRLYTEDSETTVDAASTKSLPRLILGRGGSGGSGGGGDGSTNSGGRPRLPSNGSEYFDAQEDIN